MIVEEDKNDIDLCNLFFSLQITMKWLDDSHNNVNYNISLAQFSFAVQLMDSYSTDYYDISYPGLIMRVMWRNILTKT